MALRRGLCNVVIDNEGWSGELHKVCTICCDPTETNASEIKDDSLLPCNLSS